MDWLLNTDSFLVRSHCGDWPAWMITAYQVANAAIALACTVIPIALLTLWGKRRDVLPRGGMVLLFSCFILACGLTHLLDVFVFVWPAYRFFLLVDIVAAIISVATACVLPSTIRYLLTLASPEEYRRQTEQLRLEMAAREAIQRQLTSRNKILTEEADAIREQITQLEWREDIKNELLAMREHLHRIRGA